MKPAPFEYVAPQSMAETLEVLAEHGGEAKLLAGGQSLIPVMNFRLAQPAVLVDLNNVPGLDGIEPTPDGGIRVGAMCRVGRIERDPEIASRVPLLAEAVPFIAHPQIRNRGTVGGSLAHADPAAELPTVATALRARLRLMGRTGERWVEAGEFFTGLFSTLLQPEEILVELELPVSPPRTGWAFKEVSRRHGDYAHVGVAAMVSLAEDGSCSEARLVYLSVGDAPVEARRAALLMPGETLTPDLLEAVAEKVVAEEIEPSGDIHASADFKSHLARVLTQRALVEAAARATGAGKGD